MLPALLLFAAAAANLAPMRWHSADPRSLDLLVGTPINCLLVEKDQWSAELVGAIRNSRLEALAVLRPGDEAEQAFRKATKLGFTGFVLEGDFEQGFVSKLRNEAGMVIELPSRAQMRFDAQPVVGTFQGVWPGIHAEEEDKATAAPTGAPWIHTNGGFLRFVRSAAPNSPVWIAHTPPEGQAIPAERYMQAITDAAIVGARWVLALDRDLWKHLEGRDERALAEWQKIVAMVSWWEAHPEWRSLRPLSKLALVQDAESGALFSGGLLDMIAVKHTPVLPVPSRQLASERLASANLAVNVSPGSLTDVQKEALRAFARRGGTTLSGPPTWKFPSVTAEQITLAEDDVQTLDEIWREVNSLTGRRNLGVRLFNVSSMLSNLLEKPGGRGAVLHLVNYSGYPVENITVHLLGKYKSARLLAPGAEPRQLEIYEIDEGSGVDVDEVGVTATLLLEAASSGPADAGPG